ncbi:hypothetical protein HOY80DRAFT_899805, partial [Tuber brumale]
MDSTSASSSAFRSSNEVTGRQSGSLTGLTSSNHESRENQERASPGGGMPQATEGVQDVASAPGGWGKLVTPWNWIPNPFTTTIEPSLNSLQQTHSERPTNVAPETLSKGVVIGSNNKNTGNLDNCYNITSYSGNAKHFSQDRVIRHGLFTTAHATSPYSQKSHYNYDCNMQVYFFICDCHQNPLDSALRAGQLF